MTEVTQARWLAKRRNRRQCYSPVPQGVGNQRWR